MYINPDYYLYEKIKELQTKVIRLTDELADANYTIKKTTTKGVETMSELKTKVTQTKGGGFLIENPFADTIKFTCGDGSIVEVPELSLRLILTRLYISYTRDVCGLRRSAVTWLNDVFEEKHTYKFWQKEFKRNGVHKALKIREPDM